MKTVLVEMTKKKFGMTCVVDEDGTLSGIITDGDLRRALQKFKEGLHSKTAAECMTPNPKTIGKDALAAKALNLMEENKITSLVVTSKKGKIEGIIHLHDLWRTEMF
jgi:arabinose-5-phosphate isomerase